MIDRPMDATDHPEEGLIHAWLDDALSAAEAERLTAHVQSCAECQARVAEARGLIAGASRIVAALDDAPAGARPGWVQGVVADDGDAPPNAAAAAADPPNGGSVWRWLRVTPGRAALAATILVAIGITLTYDRASVDSTPRPAVAVLNPQRTDAPGAPSAEGAASDAAKPRDALLDSAVAKNVMTAQGKRTLEPVRGVAIPSAPPQSTTLDAPAGAAGEAVALGRAEEEARRESVPVVADRVRSRSDVTGAVASVSPEATSAAAANQSQRAAASPPVERSTFASGAMMSNTEQNGVAKSCVLIESGDVDAHWADQPFPFVLAIDPGAADAARDAAVLTPGGAVTSLRAQWSRRGGDSVAVRLRRIGYSGSIVLGPDAGTRAGVAVSSAVNAALEEVVVSSAPAQSRSDARKAAPAAAKSAAAGPPIRRLDVTARRIRCPAR